MPLIKEYRIVLPLKLEEYHIGQLYGVAKMSKQETGGGMGVEVLKNEPYVRGTESGQYTHKIYHVGERAPKWIQAIVPTDALKLEEKAWNAYPICGTYLSNMWATSFKISAETIHKADRGETENIHNLSPEKLRQRQVVMVDIANDYINPNKYKPEEDPKLFHSERTGRGPLNTPNWTQTCQPYMCCYKLITVEFPKLIIGSPIEKFVHEYYHELNLLAHRQIFCSMDEWIHLNMDDIRRIEAETTTELLRKLDDKNIAQPINPPIMNIPAQAMNTEMEK